MAEDELVVVTLNVRSSQREALRALSQDKGETMSAHMREALADYLSRGDVRRKLQEVKDG